MSLLLEMIRTRVSRNQNVIGFVVGPTGVGKSYTSLRLGEVLDPNFSIKNVCFSFKQVLDLIESKTLKPGAVVVFEEVGINIDARNYFDKSNKNMAYILESFRTDRLVFLMNVPDQNFADKKARKLAHVILEMMHVDYVHNQGVGKVKWIQNNPVNGKTYYKPTRGVVNKSYSVIRSTRFAKPDKKLCKQYEVEREKFLDGVKAKAREVMEEKAKPKKVNKQPMDFIKELREEFGSIVKVKEHLTNSQGNLSVRHISGMLSIGPSKASVIKDYLDSATS